MKKSNLIIGIVLAIAVLAGGAFWYVNNSRNNKEIIEKSEKECAICINQRIPVKECKKRGYCKRPEKDYLGIKKEADKRIKKMLDRTTVYIDSPKQLSKKDFPQHNIDITKYFTPVPFVYDPKIKVRKRFFDVYYIENETNEDVREAGEYAHSYTMIRRQKMCDEGEIPEEVCRRDDPWLEKCYADTERALIKVKAEICRGEKLRGSCDKQCVAKLKEKDKNNELSHYERYRLKKHNDGVTTIYDGCNLPDEIKYQIFIKQYDEKNKCFDNWLEKLKEEDRL